MSQPAISLEHVDKTYNGKTAVKDVNWSVPRGTVAGLVGPNGAGKTTTLSMLVGLVRPTRGTIRVCGMDPVIDTVRVLEHVGFVPEEDALYHWMTVADALAFVRPFYPRWSEKWVARCLDAFRLGRKEKVGKMSRGMRRQLQLTLALAMRPEVLILDEPTAGLDPENRRALVSLLVDAVAEEGASVVLSTHELHEVERFADSVAILRAGRMVTAGSLDALKLAHMEVRVVFADEVPDGFADWPEVAQVRQDGRMHVISVTGGIEELVMRLKTYHPVLVDVVERNLEEVYLHTAREEEHDDPTDPTSRS